MLKNDPRITYRDFCIVRQFIKDDRVEELKKKKEYVPCLLAYKNAKTPCLQATGNPESEIMFIGMCPGDEEDDKGHVFIGPSGGVLQQFYLKPLDLDYSKVYITNAVKCYHKPGNNPKSATIRNCAQILRHEIQNTKCKFIIVLGEVAWRGLMIALYGKVPRGYKFSAGDTYIISPEDPDLAFPLDRELKILSLYHPAFVLRKNINVVGPQMTKYIKDFLCPQTKFININYRVLTDYQDIKEFFGKLFANKDDKYVYVVLDLETEKLDPIRDNKILCIGIATSPTEAVVIPIYSYNSVSKQLEYVDVEPAMKEIFRLLKENLENPNLKIIGHNIKYDALVLYRNLGIDIVDNIYADTRLMAHLIDSEEKEFRKDLKSLVRFRGSLGDYAKDIKEAFANDTERDKWYQKVGSNAEIWQYCAYDVCGNYEIFNSYYDDLINIGLSQSKAKEKYDQEIEKSKGKGGPFRLCLLYPAYNLYRFFFKVLMYCYRIAIKMELKGIPFSREYCEELNEELDHKIKVLEAELNELAGKEINWKSSKQLTELFLSLNYPVVKRTPKGSPSFDNEALEILANKGYPIPQKLLEFRKCQKMKSVYAEMYKSYAHRIVENIDGDIFRLACEIDMAGTETGRWSTRNPSLHTIPRDNKYRNMVKAPKGWVIMNADYSMAELRVIAGYANCKNMLDAFQSGVDFHKLMAAQLFKKDIDDVTSEERTFAKRVNFGIPYGISPYGLASMLKKSHKECKKIMDEWFNANWEVREFIAAVKRRYENGKVGDVVVFQNIFGRMRRIPREPKYIQNQGQRVLNSKYLHNEREAINFYPQSTVADILHLGLARLDYYLKQADLSPYCNILLTIHDAVLLEVEEEKVEEVAEIVKKALEFPVRFPFVKIILPVDISWDTVWRKD